MTVRYFEAGDPIPPDIERVEPPHLQRLAVFMVPVRVEEHEDGMHVYPLAPGKTVIYVGGEGEESVERIVGAPTALHRYETPTEGRTP